MRSIALTLLLLTITVCHRAHTGRADERSTDRGSHAAREHVHEELRAVRVEARHAGLRPLAAHALDSTRPPLGRSRVPGGADRVRGIAERCPRLHRLPHDVQRVASDERGHLRREGAHRGVEPSRLSRRDARRRARVDRRPPGHVAHRELPEVRRRRQPAEHRSRGRQPPRQPQPADHAAHRRARGQRHRRDQARIDRRQHVLRRALEQVRDPGRLAGAGAEPAHRRRTSDAPVGGAGAGRGVIRRDAGQPLSVCPLSAAPTTRCRHTWNRFERC